MCYQFSEWKISMWIEGIQFQQQERATIMPVTCKNKGFYVVYYAYTMACIITNQ